MKPAAFVELGLRVMLAGVFGLSGWPKLQDPFSFADSIASFELLPLWGISAVALGVPLFELLTALMLLAGWPRRAGPLAAVSLTALFGLALASALVRGLVVDCGCFGGGEPSLAKTWMALGRDVCLLAAAGAILARELHRESSRRGNGGI